MTIKNQIGPEFDGEEHRLSVKDHQPLQEIGGFLADMSEQFDQHALQYAVAYWLHVTENGPRPKLPPLHGFVAKAIREVVLDTAAMDRRQRVRRDAA